MGIQSTYIRSILSQKGFAFSRVLPMKAGKYGPKILADVLGNNGILYADKRALKRENIDLGNETAFSRNFALYAGKDPNRSLETIEKYFTNDVTFLFSFDPLSKYFLFSSVNLGHTYLSHGFDILKRSGSIDKVSDVFLGGVGIIQGSRINALLVTKYTLSPSGFYKRIENDGSQNNSSLIVSLLGVLKDIGCQESVVVTNYFEGSIFSKDKAFTINELLIKYEIRS